MSSAGSSNSEYVTARVSARRAKLYDEEDYRRLLRQSPAEIARDMEEGAYEAEMNALGARFSGVDLIEFALNRNLAAEFSAILRWAEGPLYDLIARYLRKFDAWNVKTLLRGAYSDTEPDQIRADLIRAGELRDDRLDRLAEAGGVEEVVEGLADTRFGRPLADALSEFDTSGILVPLENAVDRAHYERLLENLSGGPELSEYREFLQAEIDFRNAINAFRLARSGADVDPAEYYIAGGALFTAADLQRLAGSPEELAAAIRESRYGDDLSDALDAVESADSLVEFERALDAALLEYARSLGTVYPLSVTPVVSYVLAKEREVDNIRAIARGKEAGLSADEIERELVIL
ncbi:MAG: V-type ATP synthase subunit C [Halobaculum sp.]